MNCDCGKKAKYLVYGHMEPHCLEHMLEALCSIGVTVIDLEALEAKWRERTA